MTKHWEGVLDLNLLDSAQAISSPFNGIDLFEMEQLDTKHNKVMT